jgi:hypothetical protein
MTPDEFKTAIEKLRYSQVGIAKIFGVNGRTARRWASGANDIPRAVEMQINSMIEAGGITQEIMADVISGRIDKEFGEGDVTRFLWVMPKMNESRWIVAEHDQISDVYYLPGNVNKFTIDELHLGPVVDLPDGEVDPNGR